MALLIQAARQIDADVWKVEAFSVPWSLISPHANHFFICLNIFRFVTTNCASHIIPSHKREQEQKLQAIFLVDFFLPPFDRKGLP